jgi:hypothetical protein
LGEGREKKKGRWVNGSAEDPLAHTEEREGEGPLPLDPHALLAQAYSHYARCQAVIGHGRNDAVARESEGRYEKRSH